MERQSSILAAFTEEQAERLTGVSRQQLRYWDRTEFFSPSLVQGKWRAPYSRLYSFRDLAALKVIHALRNEASVSLPHLREVKDKLSHLGDDLWAKTTLYVLDRRVIFHSAELGTREEVVSGQAILEIPLRLVTGGVEDAIQAMRDRDQSKIGRIERQRNIAHNEAVVAGTRITVRSIKSFSDAGYSVRDIRKEYPTLAEEDILAAIAFEAVA